MIRPDELKNNERLLWSTGTGNDVWDLFCACIAGDLEVVKRLVDQDRSLVRCEYQYRTPLYFAMREDRLDVAEFLLDQGADPFGLGVHDSLLQMARDRGYVEIERLLEDRFSTLHGASPLGDAIAAAIRDCDIARVRALLRRISQAASCRRLPRQSADPLGDDDKTARRHRRTAGSRRRHQCEASGRCASDSTHEWRLSLSRLA